MVQPAALINGEWVTRATTADVNPADTREIVAAFPSLSKADIFAAFDAAAAALGSWRNVPVLERGKRLASAARLLAGEREIIASDITREQGKTLRESLGEVDKTIDCFDYYAGLARSAQGEVLPDGRPNAISWTQREPLGVVVCITPWNVPFAIPARKLAPALLAGDTTVLKPASLTPISAWHLMRLLVDAGIPAGVVNLVPSNASTFSEVLLTHPLVRGVAFTGSSDVGRRLIADGAARGILVQAEMGGKNALVVLEDANLDSAVRLAIRAGFALSGQQCTAASRVLISARVFDDFKVRFVDAVNKLRVGNGLHPEVNMGPVVDDVQLRHVLAAIETGRREGARLLFGGSRLEGEDYENGYYMRPTVFEAESSSLTIATDEIFGPVVTLLKVEDLDDAIEVTNATQYGLSASICTRDLSAAHRFVREAEVGLVGVNVSTAGWDVHLPFGGLRASGFHFKDHGETALDFYTRLKSVVLQPDA